MKNAVPARRSRFSCVDASLNTLTEMCRNVAGFVSLVLITSHAGVVNADNNVTFLTAAMCRRTISFDHLADFALQMLLQWYS